MSLLAPIAAVSTFLAAYVLIAADKWVTRTAAALTGAGVMLVLGLTDGTGVFRRAHRDRLERHLSAARDDGHRQRDARDRHL